jgi:acyl-CoA reductase-like NAD-dependent aldehyde dehydrogenase
VTALALTEDGLTRVCADDPATGLAVLRALGRDAAAKARETRAHLEEYVFAADIDPAVDEVVARAADAQAVLAGWPEDRVEALLTAVAEAVAGRAGELAAATVAETGIGNVADKTFKNRFASLEVNRALQGRPGIGPRPPDARGVTEIASPVGVVLGLVPMTNPVATLVFKILICLKARNALIVSHHPAAAGVGAATVELIGGVLSGHGAPVALVQSVKRASRTRTAMFLHHPEVSLILAALEAAGAAVCTPEEAERVADHVFDPGDGPLGREKLAPLLSLFTVDGTEQGLAVCKALLARQGAGTRR